MGYTGMSFFFFVVCFQPFGGDNTIGPIDPPTYIVHSDRLSEIKYVLNKVEEIVGETLFKFKEKPDPVNCIAGNGKNGELYT